MNISFIGLGLIGGSLAKMIRKKLPETTICAFDLDSFSLNNALRDNVIDKAYYEFNEHDFTNCDIIFLCAPVHSNTEYLKKLKSVLNPKTIITDVGSVKGEIEELILTENLGANFVGGHPMAGSEKSGYAASTDHLLENAYYLLTPTEEVSDDKVLLIKNLASDIGTIPLVLSTKQHDFATAAISHLPHVIAYSLVNLVKDSDDSNGTMKLIAAGGFKDITRIASSSPEMWRQICLVNGENISKLLSDYIDMLKAVKYDIDNKASDNLYSSFTKAKDYRDSFIDASPGPIKKLHILYCDIIDKSGAIATLATILATNGISIKNIAVVHNREFEEGALRVEFYDEKDLETAAILLKNNNYIIHKR